MNETKDNVSDVKQLIRIVSKLSTSNQFYDLPCKYQLNFLLDSIRNIRELLEDNTTDIHEVLENLKICKDDFDDCEYPHFSWNCDEFHDKSCEEST